MNHSAAILLRGDAAQVQVADLRHFASRVDGLAPGAFSGMDANRALDGTLLYFYCWCHGPAVPAESLRDAVLAAARASWASAVPGLEAVRLVPQLGMPGVSAGAIPGLHHVVEIDVEAGHQPLLSDWYEQEHLPGLAAVAGTVQARRLRNLDGGPQSFACYDLVSSETLQSAPWLAVRATAWATRLRPHFRNMRRNTFERLFTWQPGDGA